MVGKLVFGSGFALGYVLGARAGRDRYEELEEAWDSLRPQLLELRDSDALRELPAQARGMGRYVRQRVASSPRSSSS